MLKILIADAVEEERQALEALLCDQSMVKTCSDGDAAWELLQHFAPDILVLDLILPKTDGLSLLQKLRQTPTSPMILVYTSLTSPYVIDRLHQLGVEYALMKPCQIQAVKARLLDYMAQLEDQPSLPRNEDSRISTELLRLGFVPKLDGYSYLADAIPLFMKDPSQSITKELYVTVGQMHNKKASLVERSIRSAIEKACREGDAELWRQYFRSAPDGSIIRPSNGLFITRMAHLMLGRMEEIA